MKKLLIASLAFSAMIVSANAGCVGGSSNYCANVTVERVFVSGSGAILVKTNGDQSVLDCWSAGSNTYLTLANTGGRNALYSFFLTAQTTKAPVTVRVENGSNGCNVAYAY